MFLVPMTALQAASDDKVPGSFPVGGRKGGWAGPFCQLQVPLGSVTGYFQPCPLGPLATMN